MPGEKVLIVDDDEVFLEELKEMLIVSGYDVTAVSESEAAINTAVKIRPDVILLDLKMPTMSGFEVVKQLKNFSETNDIPIVAMSGFYSVDKTSWLMSYCGFNDCLKKPFNPVNVISSIESVINKNKH